MSEMSVAFGGLFIAFYSTPPTRAAQRGGSLVNAPLRFVTLGGNEGRR
jgi:hypothetical protein